MSKIELIRNCNSKIEALNFFGYGIHKVSMKHSIDHIRKVFKDVVTFEYELKTNQTN